MTDVMSEAFGRELAARTTFEKEAIWLPLLAVHYLNADQAVIESRTFTDCVIEGPGMIAIMNGTTFENCHMGVTENVRSLLYRPLGPRLVGAVGFSNCKFVGCRFKQVGFTSSDVVLDSLIEDLTMKGGE